MTFKQQITLKGSQSTRIILDGEFFKFPFSATAPGNSMSGAGFNPFRLYGEGFSSSPCTQGFKVREQPQLSQACLCSPSWFCLRVCVATHHCSTQAPSIAMSLAPLPEHLPALSSVSILLLLLLRGASLQDWGTVCMAASCHQARA